MPNGAKLLSVFVDCVAVKPVAWADAGDELRPAQFGLERFKINTAFLSVVTGTLPLYGLLALAFSLCTLILKLVRTAAGTAAESPSVAS